MSSKAFFTAFAAIGVLITLLSVLLWTSAGPEPKPKPPTGLRVIEYVEPGRVDLRDVRACPMILGTSNHEDICAYNPDGTINAYRGAGGWATVE